MDHVPSDSAQRDFDSSVEACIQLPCVSADVEVNESTCGWALCQGTHKVWQTVFTIVLDCYRTVEAKVLARRSLFLNCLVVIPFAVLKPVIQTAGRGYQNNLQRYLVFHDFFSLKTKSSLAPAIVMLKSVTPGQDPYGRQRFGPTGESLMARLMFSGNLFILPASPRPHHFCKHLNRSAQSDENH